MKKRFLSAVLAVTLTATMGMGVLPASAEEEGDVIQMTYTCTETGVGAHNYFILSTKEYTFEEGDVLEYDVKLLTSKAGLGGVEVLSIIPSKVEGAPDDVVNLRDATEHVDQNDVRIHPGQDLTPYANNKWFHRKVPVLNAMATDKRTANEWELPFDGVAKKGEVYQVQYDNIVVTNKGQIKTVIFQNESDLTITPAEGRLKAKVDAKFEIVKGAAAPAPTEPTAPAETTVAPTTDTTSAAGTATTAPSTATATNKTDKTGTATTAPKADKNDGLPAYAIALIVVGAVLVLGGGGTAAWYFLIYKKKK